MQATEYLNGGDAMPTETISDMDTPHRLSLTGIVEMPFGPGKPMLSALESFRVAIGRRLAAQLELRGAKRASDG